MFEVRLDDERVLRARSLLVATGMTDELPDIPALADGWASVVHHCPHCHGYEVRGRGIAVIGSTMGQLSAHLAALMRRYSRSVTFCVNGAEIDPAERRRLAAYGVRLVDAHVTQVTIPTVHEAPATIELDTGQTVRCEAIFVAPRPMPHDAILAGLGAEPSPASGLVAVDQELSTTVSAGGATT